MGVDERRICEELTRAFGSTVNRRKKNSVRVDIYTTRLISGIDIRERWAFRVDGERLRFQNKELPDESVCATEAYPPRRMCNCDHAVPRGTCDCGHAWLEGNAF